MVINYYFRLWELGTTVKIYLNKLGRHIEIQLRQINRGTNISTEQFVCFYS